jgi:UDP-glucose 4-epimerase
MGKTIAITGVNGYAASTLLPLLEADDETDKIIGIDVRPWKGGFSKIEFCHEDIRSPVMSELLNRADMLCHLSFAGEAMHDRQAADDININGLKNILSACEKSGIRKIIIGGCSSVYGFQQPAARQYSETDGVPDLPADNYFTGTAGKLEKIVEEFIRSHPDITVTFMRMAQLTGPNMENLLEKALCMQFSIFPSGNGRSLQFIHEEDLGRALFAAVNKEIPGIFNVGADDAMPLRSCFKQAGVKMIPLPGRLPEFLADLGFNLRIYPFGSDYIRLLKKSIYASNEKFSAAAGWQPAYDSETAFSTYIKSSIERKQQDNLLQALLSWIIKSGKRLKPFLPVLATFRIGRVPGVRALVPWLNPDKNSINYLPVNENIEVDGEILPSQVVHDLIESASIHVIMDKCGCRMLRDCHHYTHDIGCLFMGETALKLPHGVCRQVSKETAHAHAKKAMALGLLPMTGKVRIDNFIYMTPDRDKLLSLCFCCDCCCILTSYKHVPGHYLDGIIQPISGLKVEVTDDCVGCGICMNTCAFNAIRISDGKAVHNEQCRGCGRCERFCPEHAVKISIQNPNYADEVKERIRSYVTF